MYKLLTRIVGYFVSCDNSHAAFAAVIYLFIFKIAFIVFYLKHNIIISRTPIQSEIRFKKRKR